MKVAGNLRFATSVAFAVVIVSLAQGRNTSHTTPIAKLPTGEATEGDFIRFDHAPDAVTDRYNLSVQYLCSRPCTLGVEVVASVGRRSGVMVFRRRWKQREGLGTLTTRPLLLRFPDALAYRRDFFIRRSVDAYDVMLRAWLDHLGRHDEAGPRGGGYHQALTRVFKVLQSMPPALRPLKQHGACLSWGAELTWQVTRDRARQCPLESDTMELLKFPLASTGEKFGVICRLNPFLNRELERARLRAATDPRVTLSLWIYLLNWCGSKQCGIFHHMDPDNTFSTPVITLTDTGDVVFQVRLASGGDRAFRCHTALTLRTWHRLQFFMEGSKVTLQVESLMEEDVKTHTYEFHDDVHYNDTAGYFVIGGDKFMPGIEGYFGPIKYHRLRVEEVINHLSPEKTLQQLDKTHRMCEETKEFITAFLQALKESEDITKNNVCRSLLWDWRKRFGRQTCSALPWSSRVQRLYRPLLELLGEQNFISGIIDFRDSNATLRFGRRVFFQALQRLASRGSRGPESVSSLIPLLQVSSCLRHPRSFFLLAVIHLVGLGLPADTLQGHVYSLAGAQADDRLALMHLGYKHTQGIDGIPCDYDLAYSYYANVGRQTCADRWRARSIKQYTTEHILLQDEEALRSQMDEDHDVFHFLQFQAERGDLESQKTLARLLFWGQHGLSKDVGTAVRWYAKSALEMNDARSMYDYSILLFKGQGVKKNTTLALQLMEKAASMGLLEAVNGMGWYYSTFMADTETAVKYFEQAAKNGSRDSVYNLGMYHLSGSYPGLPGKNETAAFQHFLKAAASGHFDATVEAAWFLATGKLEGVTRDPESAVRLLKNVCEQNGHLGYVVRTGLRAYLRGSWEEALLSYAAAAEAGLGVAQNNAAHVCEELGHFYNCEWRYHNYSTFNYFPHYSGFLKMGDYYYHGLWNQPQNISLAINMYGRAGVAGSAQGIFNLAVLIQEGHGVPEKILEQLNISKQDHLDISRVLEKLYQRCREYEDEEDLSPCSLALFRLQLGRAWETFTHDPPQCLLAYVIATACIAALLTHAMQNISRRGVQVHPGVDTSHGVGGAVGEGAGMSPVNRDEVNRNGWQGVTIWPLIGGEGLRLVGDWAFTVMGVGLCGMHIILLLHLL